MLSVYTGLRDVFPMLPAGMAGGMSEGGYNDGQDGPVS